MSDKPGVVVPEIPPRPSPTMASAVTAFVLSLLTLIALHFHTMWSLWLSIATVAATGLTVYLIHKDNSSWSGRGSTKTPGIDPHGPRR